MLQREHKQRGVEFKHTQRKTQKHTHTHSAYVCTHCILKPKHEIYSRVRHLL